MHMDKGKVYGGNGSRAAPRVAKAPPRLWPVQMTRLGCRPPESSNSAFPRCRCGFSSSITAANCCRKPARSRNLLQILALTIFTAPCPDIFPTLLLHQQQFLVILSHWFVTSCRQDRCFLLRQAAAKLDDESMPEIARMAHEQSIPAQLHPCITTDRSYAPVWALAPGQERARKSMLRRISFRSCSPSWVLSVPRKLNTAVPDSIQLTCTCAGSRGQSATHPARHAPVYKSISRSGACMATHPCLWSQVLVRRRSDMLCISDQSTEAPFITELFPSFARMRQQEERQPADMANSHFPPVCRYP